ncbi:MAG: autotransporter-associated beta strand repeat-containing protein [Pirellulales bacterium]
MLLTNGVKIANPITIGPNGGLAASGLIQAGAGSATITGPVTIQNPALGGHFAANGGTLFVAGPIMSSVPVTVRLGPVVFSGGGIGYSQLSISQGTIYVGADDGIATTAVVDLSGITTASLDLAGFDQTLAGLTRVASQSATVTNSGGAATLNLNVSGSLLYGNDTTSQAIIAGNLSLVKSGSGTQTLSGSGANTYVGSTTVQGGVLRLAKAQFTNAVPSGNQIVVKAGGTLQLGQNHQIADDIVDFTIQNGTFDVQAFREDITPAIKLEGCLLKGSGGTLLARGGFVGSGVNRIESGIALRAADTNCGRFDIRGGRQRSQALSSPTI